MISEPKDKEEEEEEDKESARVPRHPYKDRPDVGMLGILSASYNGCGSSHVEADLKSAPARILLLQHVSESMLQTLRGDRGPPQPRDAPVDIRGWEHLQAPRDHPGSGLQGWRCAPHVQERLARMR